MKLSEDEKILIALYCQSCNRTQAEVMQILQSNKRKYVKVGNVIHLMTKTVDSYSKLEESKHQGENNC